MILFHKKVSEIHDTHDVLMMNTSFVTINVLYKKRFKLENKVLLIRISCDSETNRIN